MTWSYSGDPSVSEKDEVRFLIGDTDTNEQLVQDEEVNYSITKQGSVIKAAVSICRSIAAKFARQSDYKIGDESESASQKSDQYQMMADRLEKEALTSSIEIFAGGLTKSEKETLKNDTGAVKPSFRKDMMDNEYSENLYEDGDC